MTTLEKQKIRVIDSLYTFVVAVVVIGPFALPLLWRNPRFSRKTKILASVAVTVLTVALFWISGSSLKHTWDQFQELRALLRETR